MVTDNNPNRFANAGSLTKTCCATTSEFSVPLTGNGAVTVDSGTLNVDATGGMTNSGTVTIASAAKLLVGVGYTQSGSGTLNLRVGGPPSGGQFSQLALTAPYPNGSIKLAGTLNISLVNGYLPANGDSFPVISFGGQTETGTFTAVKQQTTDRGTFQVSYNQTSVNLTASNFIPTPTPSPSPTATGTPAATPTPSNASIFLPFLPNR